MRVIVNGALGRMGQAVREALLEQGHTPVALVDARATTTMPEVLPALSGFTGEADVLIDFSAPAALSDVLSFAVARRIPAVLATTGYTPADNALIRQAAEQIGLFQSANMSVGINLLRQLIRRAAQALGDGFDVEIVETHHNKKKDAPSGTALMLATALEDAYETPRTLQMGRSGVDALRQKNEIGIHALRGGTVPGTHEVQFFGPDEIITISHTAQSRSIFASGAVRAAQYLVQIGAASHPGLYDMEALLTI